MVECKVKIVEAFDLDQFPGWQGDSDGCERSRACFRGQTSKCLGWKRLK